MNVEIWEVLFLKQLNMRIHRNDDATLFKIKVYIHVDTRTGTYFLKVKLVLLSTRTHKQRCKKHTNNYYCHVNTWNITMLASL